MKNKFVWKYDMIFLSFKRFGRMHKNKTFVLFFCVNHFAMFWWKSGIFIPDLHRPISFFFFFIFGLGWTWPSHFWSGPALFGLVNSGAALHCSHAIWTIESELIDSPLFTQNSGEARVKEKKKRSSGGLSGGCSRCY